MLEILEFPLKGDSSVLSAYLFLLLFGQIDNFLGRAELLVFFLEEGFKGNYLIKRKKFYTFFSVDLSIGLLGY